MHVSAECHLVAALVLVLTAASAAQADEPTYVYERTIPGYYLSHGFDMAVDTDGNAYVIAAWYQDHQHQDILVVKLDPDGTPLWTVPIIGDPLQYDSANGITLDAAGDVWITGGTSSDDFPTTPDALYPDHIHFLDAFVMKLDSEDGAILYSTYLGGDYTDQGYGIALNDAGEIYVVGTTGSTDFPTTEDAYQDHPSAPLYVYTDAFITKLSAAGDEILYSTYFGGFKDDQGKEVAIDAEGNVVLAGLTNSDDFPLENPISADPDRIFISKLSADGSTLQFSTYFGGEDLDDLRGMAMDSEGFVYITGSTRSADFPTTPGAFQEDFAGGILACGTPPFDPLHNCEDAFVTKLATDGSGVIYSTYLGGSIVDVGHDIAVDGGRCAYLVGYTISPDFPGSDEPFGSIVVSKLNAAGSELIYTFTKTSGSADSGNSIAIGPTGDVYFAAAVHVPADFYAARITAGFTSVAAQEETRGAATVRLGPGTPNPFNTETTIRYDLSGRERVDLRVFDVAGHLVQVLESGDEESAGRHEVTWTGRDRKGREVPPGVYFYRLEAGDYTETRRIVLIR